ncbi:hypothetical protein MRB53_013549 [Persea americana]|uniref:Uncharacterized protein n=1 Tax=Persea americana TaxID=3435 RepID=A0ACC2K899_PERAE|nr:hypothetical protein MRB53_013549 [Persea americana]
MVILKRETYSTDTRVSSNVNFNTCTKNDNSFEDSCRCLHGNPRSVKNVSNLGNVDHKFELRRGRLSWKSLSES